MYNNTYNSAADNVYVARHSYSANEGHLPRNLARLDNKNGLKTLCALNLAASGKSRAIKRQQYGSRCRRMIHARAQSNDLVKLVLYV